MLTGPLIFIGPLTVGRASDSQRGPVFLAGPDGQRGPTALTCFFVGFRTDFVTCVQGCGAGAGAGAAETVYSEPESEPEP